MIEYITGDATNPQRSGPLVIPHVVNNLGAWGAGFVMALSRHWPEAAKRYHFWAQGGRSAPIDPISSESGDFGLGEVQFVEVESDIWVANMCAQNGFPSRERPVAVDYEALEQCLAHLADFVTMDLATTVHAPRFGAGIAGGSWPRIEAMIKLALPMTEIYIYDLPPRR